LISQKEKKTSLKDVWYEGSSATIRNQAEVYHRLSSSEKKGAIFRTDHELGNTRAASSSKLKLHNIHQAIKQFGGRTHGI
jgi:hypothetical protein